MDRRPELPNGEEDAVWIDPAATPLCPHCLAELPPRAPFCPKCNAPVGAYATYDPIQQIYSTGWLYRRAIGSGISTIALIGMWIIFGPTALLMLIAIIARLVRGGRVDLVTAPIAIAACAISTVILFIVTRSYVRFKRRKPGQCLKCHYNLVNLPEPRCPECGTPFDPQWVADELEMAGEDE